MDWTSFETAGGIVGWVTGEGDGVALVVHGGPGMSDYTETLADEVAAALPDHRIARYQQRGLAPSVTDGPFTGAQHVDDLFAVADHLDGASLVLVGHSWGGHLVMLAAAARPQRLAGMVLLDTLGAIGDGGQGTMEAVIGSRLTEAAITELMALGEAGLSPTEAGSAQIRLIWPGYFADPASAPEAPPIVFDLASNGATMEDVNAGLADGTLAAALPLLSIPSVHLIGRASPIDPASSRATAALFAGATVIELDTGHFAWLEQPGSVTDAVRALRLR
jgi:pimeloyl-ACP methyl ester carboxylesterase